MIYYNGTKKTGTVNYICFKNDLGKEVQVPVDEIILHVFETYMDKLQPAKPELVERGNDEESL